MKPETISSVEKEVAAYLDELRAQTYGRTIAEEYALDEGHNITLIVEYPVMRKEVVEDLGITIIYRTAPFTADVFRGRTLCGVVYRTSFEGAGVDDALRNSLRICKHSEIPVHVS